MICSPAHSTNATSPTSRGPTQCAWRAYLPGPASPHHRPDKRNLMRLNVFARQVAPVHLVADSGFAQTVLATHRALAKEPHYLVVGHPGDLAGDLVRAVGVW
jgi:hypothetical protein